MLPRLEDKSQARELGPYRAFTREILTRKHSDNNITKLKLLREFLDDDSGEEKKYQSVPIHIPKLPLKQKSIRNKNSYDKENQTSMYHVRKTSTAENPQQHKQIFKQPRIQSERDRSIFAVPDKFRLSELVKNGNNRFRRQKGRQMLNISVKMNDKLSSNRIL